MKMWGMPEEPGDRGGWVGPPRPRGMCRIQEGMQTDSDPWSSGDTGWDTGGIERASLPERVAFRAAKREGALPPFRDRPSDQGWGGRV